MRKERDSLRQNIDQLNIEIRFVELWFLLICSLVFIIFVIFFFCFQSLSTATTRKWCVGKQTGNAVEMFYFESWKNFAVFICSLQDKNEVDTLFNRYVKERTEENPKFWIVSFYDYLIIEDLDCWKSSQTKWENLRGGNLFLHKSFCKLVSISPLQHVFSLAF